MTAIYVVVATCWLLGAAAAPLTGSQTSAEGGITLSCTTSPTCGDLSNLAWEAYYFPIDLENSTATCLCRDGMRVKARGNGSDPTIEFRRADGPVGVGECAASMTWSQASPFVGACSYGVSQIDGTCSDECAAKVAPFSGDCFSAVMTNGFFKYAPGVVLPEFGDAFDFYENCQQLPRSPPPAPPAPAPASPPSSAPGGSGPAATLALAALAAALWV